MSIDVKAMQKALRAYAAVSEDGSVNLGGMQAALEAYESAKASEQPDEYTYRQDIHDAVVNGLRHYFSDHGDMTPADIGSATKRIMGKVWEICKPERELMDHDRVNIPVHEDEAAMMVLLGTDWLEKHAPQRLRKRESGIVAKAIAIDFEPSPTLVTFEVPDGTSWGLGKYRITPDIEGGDSQ